MRFLPVLFLLMPLLGQTSENVVLRGHVALSEMGLNPSEGSDIWGFTHADGREYAFMTSTTGTHIFDITNPDVPVEIDSIDGTNSTWRDVKTYVYDDRPESFSAYAFIVNDNSGGMQVLDISNLPTSVTLVTTFHGISSAHNIFIDPKGGQPYAYLAGSNQGFAIVDISDPLDPAVVGTWLDAYVHDFFMSTTWADSRYDGKEIGLAFCGTGNMTVLDLTDKSNPVTLEEYVYPGLRYCHSGWTSDDGRYAYVCDEFDESQLVQNTAVYVIDLIDLEAPQLTTIWYGDTRAIDHNIFYKDGYLHLSNYTRGYTVLDATQPDHPVQLGYYDTFPDNDGSSYNGAWGAYPYYPSGIVAVSDIQSGLYLFEPQIPEKMWLTLGEEQAAVCVGTSRNIELGGHGNVAFHDPITLSHGDLPEGVSLNFSANPIQPGQTATVTLEITEQAPANLAMVTITGQGGSAPAFEVQLELEVVSGSDASPEILQPANGAACTGATGITLRWASMGLERTYQVQIATDRQFEDTLRQYNTDATELVFEEPLLDNQIYYWRVRSDNACGSGNYGQEASFFTSPPTLLLVDDDDNNPDARPYITTALDAMGIEYHVYEVEGGASGPSLEIMSQYEWLLWFSGDAFGIPARSGPNAADELVLAQYLDQGGHLLLSAQDYYYDRGRTITPFMRNYLGVGEIGNDSGDYRTLVGAGSLTEVGTLTVTPALGFELFDEVTPDSGELVLVGDNGRGAGVMTGNTLFLPFSLSSLLKNTTDESATFLWAVHQQFAISDCTNIGPCVMYDVRNDGFGMDDFQARVSLWGGDESLAGLIELVACIQPTP